MAQAFTPTPVCSPARASFFTGRLASQHGIHDYLAEGEPDVGARDWMRDETTLAQLLSDAGYHTALFGKWHCGQGVRRQPGQRPGSCGGSRFDPGHTRQGGGIA